MYTDTLFPSLTSSIVASLQGEKLVKVNRISVFLNFGEILE